MLKPATKYVLYPTLIVTDLIGWLVALVFGLAWGEGLPRFEDGVLWAYLREDSWPVRTWLKKWAAFTIGHTVVARRGGDFDRVRAHELVHVAQNEANGLLGAVLGIVLAFWAPLAGLLIWITLPWLVYLAGGAAALLRGGNGYSQNYLEQH